MSTRRRRSPYDTEAKDKSFYGEPYNPHPGVKTAKLVKGFMHGVQRIRAKRAAKRALEPPKPRKKITISPRKHVTDSILGDQPKRRRSPPPWV